MPQPKIDAMNAFAVLKHRDSLPMISKTDLTAWAKRQFPRDEFINSQKFVAWVDGGKGNHLEREMHRLLTALVAMDRLAEDSQMNLEAKEKAETERDALREERDKYRDQAHEARLQLALGAPEAVVAEG